MSKTKLLFAWLCHQYDVSEVGSVKEATNKYNLDNFDLIISDLRLPGKLGTDLINVTDTPVLIMTSYPSLKSAVDSMRMGAVDYIFGGMTAVFYQTDLVLNTSDSGSDQAYITAAQQAGGRGFLMYECNVKSAVPGVETASTNWGKPGYFGRPWAATTSEVVFYKTNIDISQNPSYTGQSMIFPVGWTSSLGGESEFMYERSTNELSGEDNSGGRASWSTILDTDQLNDGTDITPFNFTKGNDGWDPISELTLSVDEVVNSGSNVKVLGYNNSVYISNVKSATTVNIYNITGALVKTLKTKTDTSFSFHSGLYIVTVKDEVGQKALKLLVH